MKRLITVISILLFASLLYSQRNLRIGLFQEELLNSFVFHSIRGEYNIVHESGEIRLKEGSLLYFSLIGDKILTSDGQHHFGYFENIGFIDLTGHGIFRIKPVNPLNEARNYEGELELSVKHKALLLINNIDFNKYLAGVVETEGGPSAHLEFYKAQAVLCRTYAIKNFNAHSEEGFNLCDHTHCQAYKGMSAQNSNILESVLSTHNLLLTGRFLMLTDAVYHSNSGGETQRASDIWPGGAEYLQSVIDPFSLDQPNSRWERTMTLDMWRNYLLSRDINVAKDSPPENLLIQQKHRRRHFVIGSDSLRIDRIRSDFNFRSGFFDMELKDDNVIFKGKGYGHGVGMSQEGAMNMARQGFSFSDILRFYYHQIQIRDIMGVPDEYLPEEFK